MLAKATMVVLGVFFLNALWLGVHRAPVDRKDGVEQERLKRIREVTEKEPVDRGAVMRVVREDAVMAARWGEYMKQLSAATGGDGNPGAGDESDPALPEDEAPEVDGAEDADWTTGIYFKPELPEFPAECRLPEVERGLFREWHAALFSKKAAPELVERLSGFSLPGWEGIPLAMAGDLKRQGRDFKGALELYEKAAGLSGGDEARRRAVDLAMSREWPEVLDRLLAEPAYYAAVHAVDDRLARDASRHQLDVREILKSTLKYTWEGLHQVGYLTISLLAGLVWFVSLHKACRLPRRQWWLSLAGLPLGAFSTVVTLVLMEMQEARNGLTESELAGPALLFQIASVGLREEGSKLLCFLPMLLFLRRGTPAQALMAASAVGLGFAIEENISYFAMSEGTSVMGRHLTANFMHLAMTGLTGHALFRFLRYPKHYGAAFVATFTCMVLIHGLYNFSQDDYRVPLLKELPQLVVFIVVGLAWHYFQVIKQEREDAAQVVSAHGVFLLGTAAVMGVLLNFLVWENGWGTALGLFVPTALGSVLMCWLFMRFLHDS
ncbi:MAG: hypothetical protein JWL81_2776 [Verrucomicrobiales bacterium]|nr:hypothetical protein [Verrucomicrobiales bacterium]